MDQLEPEFGKPNPMAPAALSQFAFSSADGGAKHE